MSAGVRLHFARTAAASAASVTTVRNALLISAGLTLPISSAPLYPRPRLLTIRTHCGFAGFAVSAQPVRIDFAKWTPPSRVGALSTGTNSTDAPRTPSSKTACTMRASGFAASQRNCARMPCADFVNSIVFPTGSRL